MAIVKMKQLQLVAPCEERDALFLALQRLGCVEISEFREEAAPAVSKASTEALDEALALRQTYENALALLRRYAPKKKPLLAARPELNEAELFDPRHVKDTYEAAQKLLAMQQRITALRSERAKGETLLASLLPWRKYEVPLEITETESTALFLGTLPPALAEAQLGELIASLEGLAQFEIVSRDKSAATIAFLCHKSVRTEADSALKAMGFTRSNFRGISGTAEENISRLTQRQILIDSELAELEGDIRAMADYHDALQLALDRSATECEREEAKTRLAATERTVLLCGWFPAGREDSLRALLAGCTCAFEISDPAPEDYPEVPVLLKNNRLTAPLSMVTEMYSLPAYGAVDPNPLMAPFFILFYGIMMADMGYGLLMMLASYIVMKKTKPKGATMRHLVPLLGLCGVSTFIMGALTGGFFGDFPTQVVKILTGKDFALPSLFNPLDDTLMILIGSMALGAVHIITGMAVSFVRKIKAGRIMDAVWEELTWWIVFIGIALMVLGVTSMVLALGGVMILVGAGWNAKGFGKVTAVFSSLYNHITGFFGDILSYSRLMALMLAGSVIAQVFNTLGAIPGNIFIFLLISFAGNALNFALNLLGCYVHDLRLQCLEYFGKFYEDGGKPFRPLAFNTTYVDIAEK